MGITDVFVLMRVGIDLAERCGMQETRLGNMRGNGFDPFLSQKPAGGNFSHGGLLCGQIMKQQSIY